MPILLDKKLLDLFKTPSEQVKKDFGQTRPLYASEDDYFQKNPNVAGMASFDDNKVILNPYSLLNPEQLKAVQVNEAARLYMNQYGTPNVSLTNEQQSNLAGLDGYAQADLNIQRSTILARILSGDKTGGIPTMEQQEALKPLLFLKALDGSISNKENNAL